MCMENLGVIKNTLFALTNKIDIIEHGGKKEKGSG